MSSSKRKDMGVINKHLWKEEKNFSRLLSTLRLAYYHALLAPFFFPPPPSPPPGTNPGSHAIGSPVAIF